MIFIILLLSSAIGVLASESDDAKLSCYLISDWTIFDLRSLQRAEDYTYGNLVWNFCKMTQWPIGQTIRHAETHAYFTDDTGFAWPLTDDALVPDDTIVRRDTFGNAWPEFT